MENIARKTCIILKTSCKLGCKSAVNLQDSGCDLGLYKTQNTVQAICLFVSFSLWTVLREDIARMTDYQEKIGFFQEFTRLVWCVCSYV